MNEFTYPVLASGSFSSSSSTLTWLSEFLMSILNTWMVGLSLETAIMAESRENTKSLISALSDPLLKKQGQVAL